MHSPVIRCSALIVKVYVASVLFYYYRCTVRDFSIARDSELYLRAHVL